MDRACKLHGPYLLFLLNYVVTLTLYIPKSFSKQHFYQLKWYKKCWEYSTLFVNGQRNEHVFKKSYFTSHVSSGEKDLRMWYQTDGMAEKSKHSANWQAKYSGLYIHNANMKLSEGQITNCIMRPAPNSKLFAAYSLSTSACRHIKSAWVLQGRWESM
jgi:hypothetical protein